MPKSVCVLLLGTALLSCSDQKEIQITGTVRNLNGGMIVYQQSIGRHDEYENDRYVTNPKR